MWALEGTFEVRRLNIGATVIAGQPVIPDEGPGDITDPASTTDFSDVMGVTKGAGTYSAAQGATGQLVPVVLAKSADGSVVWRCIASGAAASGTALATTSPANVLTNTTADAAGLVITAAEVGTIDMSGGTIWGLTGANKGQSRRIASDVDNTSTTVTKAFDNALAVDDKFLRVPWGIGETNLQLCTEFDQANAIIASGTGGRVYVKRVTLGRGCSERSGQGTWAGNFDPDNPIVFVDFFFVNSAQQPFD